MVPMGLWQTANYQTCNTLHEMEKANHNEMFMRFINCGESRCTFLFQDNTDRTVVFKTLKLREDPKKPTHFGGRGAYRRAIKDSLALEKLTSSPYIVDIYASCELGQIQEYSVGGNIHDLLKRSRKEKQLDSGQRVPTKEQHTHHNKHHDHHHHEDDGATADKFPHRPLFISPISKLKIAFHVASAVADMHSLEQHPDGLPSMVHNDLCCHQFLLVDGIYKLGDFDWVTFLTQTTPAGLPGATTTNLRRHLKPEVCQTTPVVFNHDYHKALAPEEFPYYKDLKRALEEEGYKDEHHAITRVHRDKMDVYQIGTLLYTLVTHKWIWEGRTTDSAMVEATHGQRAPFPDKQYSGDTSDQDQAAIQSLKKAIGMAWMQNPMDRPTARALAKHLKFTLQSLVSDTDDMLRVRIPPLPLNHRYTDSDFVANWEFGRRTSSNL